MKAPIKRKPILKRTYAKKIALANRISNRATIEKMLKRAETLDKKIIEIKQKIRNTKGQEKQKLLTEALKLNTQKGQLLIEANKLHRINQKKKA